MENMHAGTEAPTQMQAAFSTIRNAPLVARKPAPLTCRFSAKFTTLNITKAADMKQDSFRIAEGVFMCTAYTDALSSAGDLLSATAAQKRIIAETIRGAGLPVRHSLTPAVLISTAQQQNQRSFNLPHSLPEC